MIIEVRSKPITITNSEPVFSFRTTGGGSWPVWDRFIAIHDSLAVQIGNVCGTCAFFFQRVATDPEYVNAPAEVSTALNRGLTCFDDKLISAVAKVVPNGRYRVALSSGVPVLVTPGDANDYFVHEQPALWNEGYLANGPHDPGTEYYRLGARQLSEETELFEFMVPMISSPDLRTERVNEYLYSGSNLGTVLTVSVLDVKGPADLDEAYTSPLVEHSCFTHYILDGHHKAHAAAIARRQIEILSLVSVDNSVASDQEIDRALTALKHR